MAFLGLIPREHSSGGTEQRGGITKAGNGHVRRLLIEAAWHYRHRPGVKSLSKRREGAPPEVIALADKAMQMLPEGMREARMLSVQRDKFVLGIPSADAFALWRIPQGKAVAYGPKLREVAAVKELKRDDVVSLEKILLAAASAAEKK